MRWSVSCFSFLPLSPHSDFGVMPHLLHQEAGMPNEEMKHVLDGYKVLDFTQDSALLQDSALNSRSKNGF